MKRLFPATLLTLAALLLVLAALVSQSDAGRAQAPVQLGADTDPEGNTAASLGTTQGCVPVSAGDTFDFDIFVSDVVDLIHWELYLKFNPPIIAVDSVDLNMFLANNPRSSLTVQWVPLSGGRHFLGAADTRGAPESGSGVLARLTLQAQGPGLSEATIFSRDADGDGDIDLGPRLTASGGVAVGDVTGDGVFDGPTYHAFIAVDESCAAATPTPTLPPSPTPQPGGSAPPSGTPTETEPAPEPLEAELARVFGVEPDDADAADSEDVAADDTEDDSAPVVLAEEGTPAPPDSGSNPDRAPGGDSSPASSSGGGLPLWAIGSIAAAVLVAAAGVSVYLAARAGGRFWR